MWCSVLTIEIVQKYHVKSTRWTSILSGKSYVKEVLEGYLQVCYDMFCMYVHIFKHLCNGLKRLHQLEKDTSIVLVEESVGTFLYVVGHNTDFRLIVSRFHHSLETIQRRFYHALRAIHSMGCLIIRFDDNATELPHHLRENKKYYPWFKVWYYSGILSLIQLLF